MSDNFKHLDLRLLSVSFVVDGETNTFNQDAYITVRGCKYANAIQNECEVSISNLNHETRNYILQVTSPFNMHNQSPKVATVSAGRVSTGLFLVYTGNVVTSKITQPPDIGLSMKCGTAHCKKGKVGHRSGSQQQSMMPIATQVALNLELKLRNEAADRHIANYSHNGDALSEVDKLKSFGVDAYVDDDTLVVKEKGVPLTGEVLDLDDASGMIGIPEITEKGLKVKMLFDNRVKIGGGLNITSKLNPAANGLFVIFKLSFDLTSRNIDFYYTAECTKAK